MYLESDKNRQARRARRAAKVLEFAHPEDGRRVVPQLTLDPPKPEEAPWVEHYLSLADRALHQDLPNPADAAMPRRRRA